MKPVTVALVDDDALELKVLAKAMRQARPGITLELLQGSDGAAEEIAARSADVVLLDVRMPGYDGFDVLAELRARQGGALPAVIMLTTSTNQADVERAYATGATAYITKPETLAGVSDLAHQVCEFWCDRVQFPN